MYYTEDGRKIHTFGRTGGNLDTKHGGTKVRRPQTNGKVEGFFEPLTLNYTISLTLKAVIRCCLLN